MKRHDQAKKKEKLPVSMNPIVFKTAFEKGAIS